MRMTRNTVKLLEVVALTVDLDIKDKPSSGKYPKITERTGASPPQYASD
jgi:hypothetical protein